MTATLGFSRGGEHREVLSTVRARIAAFSGYDEPMLEPLQATEPQWTHIDRPRGLISTCASQVVRYHPGEKYDPHHDLFDLCDFPQVGTPLAGPSTRPWPMIPARAPSEA